MKKIVVSGATSMMGMALIEQCVANHIEITALVRSDSAQTDRLRQWPGVRMVNGDLAQMNFLQLAEDDYDVFYHFAWADTSRAGRIDAILQAKNIQYTLDAVQLAHRLGCKTFIGAGSQAEYGRVAQVISPDTPAKPDIAYGAAKLAAGQLAAILCKKLDMHCIWGRIFSVYGPYDKEDTLLRYVIETLLRREKPILTGCEQQWDFLFSSDAGRAFYLLGEKVCKTAVYCVGSGTALPLLAYVTEAAQQINAGAALGIGEKPYADNQVMQLCADISTLIADTGFLPEKSPAQGIAATIEWCKGVRT